MPSYDYAAVSGGCKHCRRVFEVFQRVVEKKLKACPSCGAKVERLISASGVHTKFSVKSDSRLSELGLTKYVKTSDGSYERRTGRGGPKLIRKPDGD